ncbi:hypothetical protein BASA62_003471 [Batrachochytrium salamandrivorans]|nr:hypothetical protein BASA62_003471 [Batrachochytrium salamandrivorans]
MPLLAVAASGSTIPSTDSYNVQQLEKRGDNDPASKEFTDEDSKGQMESSSSLGSPHTPQDTFGKWDDESDESSDGSRLGSEFKYFSNQEGEDKPTKSFDDPEDISGKWGSDPKTPSDLEANLRLQGIVTGKEGPSFFSRFGRRIQDLFKKDKPKTNGQEELDNALKENREKQNRLAEDMSRAVKESNQRHSKRHGKKPSKGASNEKHPETQDIVAGGGEEKPDGSSSSSENLYMPQGNFGGWDDESEESFDAFQRNRGKQDKHDDILKAIDDLRLRRLKRKQDEEANKGASNEKLPETQAQEVVQPSGMPQTKAVSMGDFLSSPEISHDHSHDSQAEPEQANNDDERNDGRHEGKTLVEKSPTKFPKGPWQIQLTLGVSGTAYKFI